MMRCAIQTLLLLLLGSAAAEFPPSHAALLKQRGRLVEHQHHDLKFELFIPNSWTPNTGPHPVLVFLHGRGESGGFDVTNAQSLPLQLLNNHSFAATFPFIVLVPQCPSVCAHVNHWTPKTLQSTTSLMRDWILQPDASSPSIEQSKNLGGDRSRVFLAGQSMGGHGAWLYAAQQPRLFAAVVVVCGYAQGSREARTFAERLSINGGKGVGGGGRGPAVAIYHSEDDSVIPVAASDQMATALKGAGYEEEGSAARTPGSAKSGPQLRYVRYKNAPGPPMPEFAHLIGHGSYELAFRDASLYSWLLAHPCPKCGTKPPAAWVPLTTESEELR